MTGRMLTFWVDGIPETQGSKQAFVRGRRAVLVDVRPKELTAWRGKVEESAKRAMERAGWETLQPHVPAVVVAKFHLPRPPSHYRTGRNAHLLKDSAPPMPTNKQDIDKLLRAVYDAMTTAGVYHDDGQVVAGGQSKHYCVPRQAAYSQRVYPQQPGVYVSVRPFEEGTLDT